MAKGKTAGLRESPADLVDPSEECKMPTMPNPMQEQTAASLSIATLAPWLMELKKVSSSSDIAERGSVRCED
jgi:hypothetical protein